MGLLALILSCPLLASTEVSVAVASFDRPEAVQQRWQPTLDYLNQGQSQYHFVLRAMPPAELEAAMERGQIHFMIQNSVKTVQFKEKFGASQLLTAAPLWTDSADKAIGSAVVMRAGEAISSIEQLASLRVVSTSPHAFGGYLAYLRELADRGFSPTSFFDDLQFVGFPQRQLLQRLLDGTADVAILPSCLMESAEVEGRIPVGALTVALDRRPADFPCGVSSALYPYFTLSMLSPADSETATYLVRRLLELAPDDPAAQRGRYQGWTVPMDDREVYALLKSIGLWPFETDWHYLAGRAMPFAIGLALLLLAGYFHHLRVKALVARRTTELREEMAEHEQTQRRLTEQERAFYKAQRVLLTGEMAAGIAHELNQPLASIRYLAQGCGYRLEKGADSAELKEGLGRIGRQTEKAQGIIQRLKSFCARPMTNESVALDSLIEETLELMATDFRRFDCQPEVTLPRQGGMTVPGDGVLIQQVLVNLIRNGLDAMEALIPSQRQLSIALAPEADGWLVTIRDHGCGLSDEALDRLFFPFESSKPDGLGLGMMICKRIIDEHQGWIQARNAEPGLEIRVWLPGERH
ncbi:PhnD/SsuA/transferrin family substrate-binding protein [Ferrimonas balearica]|uniref:sensor histidine kinase n=1 Tax=Ferrimonas balearica TaxID=44012 RepID=UPI001C9903FE|nr:PhnD/SsuA/transferrin family substrate-binding protein [Ferrimonas balearica]MBY5921848.1 PhnD/SsuA/transferrin family substrate-binding protein [Ferrimonas balearica]MBY5994812.1 PhnD/SsuA/transferrin family substrate-binding protein [Ferrimonas balearica]